MAVYVNMTKKDGALDESRYVNVAKIVKIDEYKYNGKVLCTQVHLDDGSCYTTYETPTEFVNRVHDACRQEMGLM